MPLSGPCEHPITSLRIWLQLICQNQYLPITYIDDYAGTISLSNHRFSERSSWAWWHLYIQSV